MRWRRLRSVTFGKCPCVYTWITCTGGKHKAHRPNPAFHLVLSGPAPCFYPASVPSSLSLVKEQLHLYSPKITFGPLKATVRLMWSPVKMSLIPLNVKHFKRLLLVETHFGSQRIDLAALEKKCVFPYSSIV